MVGQKQNNTYSVMDRNVPLTMLENPKMLFRQKTFRWLTIFAALQFSTPEPAVAQSDNLIRISRTSETAVFTAGKQYYVSIECSVIPNFGDLAGKVTNKGFLNENGFHRNRKLAHFISLSNGEIEYEIGDDGKPTEKSRTKFGHLIAPYTYWNSGGRNDGHIETGQGCKQGKYLVNPQATLEGRVGYSYNNKLPEGKTSLVTDTLTLASGLGTHLGSLAFGGALSGGALGTLTDLTGDAASVETYLNRFRGDKAIIRPLVLRAGVCAIGCRALFR